MAEALRWWLSLQLLGLVALPICGLIFRAMPDRGYALSKAVGWLGAGWLAWYAASVEIAPFGDTSARYAALLLALASTLTLFLHRGGYARAWLVYFRERWSYVLGVEVMFVLGFFLFVALRGYVPDAAQTEKPMEYMYLQAAYGSASMPPADLWLSGHTVNYYYLGFFLNAFLARLSAVSPDIAFNLALAGTWAVTLVSLLGLGYNAVAAGTPARLPRLLGAALAPALVLVISNPAGALRRLFPEPGDGSFQFFWNPSRVVNDRMPGRPEPVETINEFPAFSYLLGDLHPHVMAMPAFALGLGASLALLLSARRPPAHLLTVATFAGVVLGWLYMTNSWDVPAVALLALVSVAAMLPCWKPAHWPRFALLVPPLLVLPAIATAAPFLLSFDAPVDRAADVEPWVAATPLLNTLGRYVGLVWWDHTSLSEFVRVWGFHALLIGAAAAVYTPTLRRWDRRFLAGVAAVALVPAVLLPAPVLMLAPISAMCALIALRHRSPALRWAFLLAGVGWALVMLPEIVYLRDAFESRMNTVFKFYYQAWQILGVAAAVLAVALLDRTALRIPRLGRLPIAAPLVLVVLALGLIYPVAGVRGRVEGGYRGLDSVRFLRSEDPAAYEAVEWLRANSARDDVVVEATGPPYSLYARLATYSGRPTVLGWANHEGQWRAGQPHLLREMAQRTEDLRMLYSPGSPDSKRALLRKYGASYAYYGEMERRMQAELNLPVRDPFAGWLKPSQRFGSTVLYQVPAPASARR